MPDNPLIIGETSSCSRRRDQRCHANFCEHMSEEETIADQDSYLDAYTNPTGFYMDLQDRALKNPSFLQRNLSYKIEAKLQRRIQMTVTLSDKTQKMIPLYVLMARLVSSEPIADFSEVYKFNRACMLTGLGQEQADFLLPDMDRLAFNAKSGSFAVLFISYADASQFGIDSSKIDHSGEHYCLYWGKIPLESLYSSWQKCPNMDLGQKATSVSLVEMHLCSVKLKSRSEQNCLLIKVPSNPLTSSSPQQVQVTISAGEVGPTEKSNDIPSSSMLQNNRLRAGKVSFKYRSYNNRLETTEVTEDFTCPFCLVKCASFKGLECHMPASHDLFNFDFLVNEKYQAVNVYLNEKRITWITECYQSHDYPKASLEPYFFSSKKKQKSQVGNSRQEPLKTDDADSIESGSPELQMKNMWYSFVKKHGLADEHLSWACEAFSELHGPLLVRSPHLLWNWRKYILSLRNHGLVDALTVKICNVFFEQHAN